MIDPIERQAAIDALCRRCDLAADDDEPCTEKCNDIKILEKMPSAQPEIIHCEDCTHYNAGFECLIEGYGIERSKDWFCGDAERRNDEKTNKGSSC